MTGTRTRRAPAEPALVAGCALLGLLAGSAAKAADESGRTWAADLGSYPAAWVLAVALLGRFAPTLAAAATRAAVFFAAMTVAYYAWAAWVLGFGWSSLLPVWLVLSATAVALFATAIRWATGRTGPPSGAVLAGAGGIVLAGGAVRDAGDHPVQAVADVVVVLLLVLGMQRQASTRLWALALLAPLSGLAGLGLRVLTGVLA